METRKLSDLRSVGPAAVKDFAVLGITQVDQLKDLDAKELYLDLCERTGANHDPCVIDVFRAAIEPANHPNLERRMCDWWYWSKIRKGDIV